MDASPASWTGWCLQRACESSRSVSGDRSMDATTLLGDATMGRAMTASSGRVRARHLPPPRPPTAGECPEEGPRGSASARRVVVLLENTYIRMRCGRTRTRTSPLGESAYRCTLVHRCCSKRSGEALVRLAASSRIAGNGHNMRSSTRPRRVLFMLHGARGARRRRVRYRSIPRRTRLTKRSAQCPRRCGRSWRETSTSHRVSGACPDL